MLREILKFNTLYVFLLSVFYFGIGQFMQRKHQRLPQRRYGGANNIFAVLRISSMPANRDAVWCLGNYNQFHRSFLACQ